MEIVTGALPSIIPKLAELAAGEYNLQKGLKGEIRFLQEELECMKGALEHISKVPADQLPNGDKIWARKVRELSYDIEDRIDTFMVQCKGDKLAKHHGSRNAIGRCLDLLMQPVIRHKIATEIRGVKSRVAEAHEMHKRYQINNIPTPEAATVDPRLYAQYTKMTELVGIDETRDEFIKTMLGGSEVITHQTQIVSIVGFGGLGKTTLAKAVYEKLRVQFDCSAFVTVSQTPDMKKLFRNILYQLGKTNIEGINQDNMDEWHLIDELKKFIEHKRYIILIDDIWNISHWKIIERALLDNHGLCTVITTTRIMGIAKHVGRIYMMKRLCPQNSRILFYSRIFDNKGNESCRDKDLVEVSERILKKCDGVPLAIITIASLLASKGRNIIEWYEVHKSIGTGLENSVDVENMRKILLLSYYDLPAYLKTCLLYLSVFPEDFEIGKDHLIWMWIGEGFIQCKRQGESLFEIGESYFNELVNRSMIQLVHHEYYSDSEDCRVHDMILDLIRFLSGEESFITILNDYMDHTSPSKTIRRLSLQNSVADHSVIQVNSSKKTIRSVVVFFSVKNDPGKNYPKLDLGSFRVLRVLDLNCFPVSNHYSIKYLGKLIHLRYLGLRNTYIHIPEEVGNLQFLLSLDIRNSMAYDIDSFPPAVFRITSLRCLHIGSSDGVPPGISNLKSLEVLTLRLICHPTTITELGHLTELRVVKIFLHTGFTSLERSAAQSLVETLQKLKKVKSVDIDGTVEIGNIGPLDAWSAPPHIREIEMAIFWFSARPYWMNPSHLQHLCTLKVSILELQEEDLEILGRIPALRTLYLQVHHEENGILRKFVVAASSFPSLEWCHFSGFAPPVVFWQGAMPRLVVLLFTFPVRKTIEMAGSIDGLELGLGNLTLLQKVEVRFFAEGDSKEDKEEGKAAIRHAAEIHPNRPTIIV